MFLKNQPFAVKAFFKSSFVLTFAVPKEALEPWIPECLTLDTFKDKWAFVAVALVDTKNLRPKGFPAFLGNDFFLIGYRIFVRYTDERGRRLRGLYILGSETNKMKMEYLGNIFTRYKYITTDIAVKQQHGSVQIFSEKSCIDIKLTTEGKEMELPLNSPFDDWKEARRFAGPLPFTFSYDSLSKQVLIIEGQRENWTPKPIEVIKYKIGFIDRMNLENAVLANAFMIQDIPYCWKKGRIEKWKG